MLSREFVRLGTACRPFAQRRWQQLTPVRRAVMSFVGEMMNVSPPPNHRRQRRVAFWGLGLMLPDCAKQLDMLSFSQLAELDGCATWAHAARC